MSDAMRPTCVRPLRSCPKLEREVAARRELHVYPEADVVAHAMPVPLPLVALAVEFLADDPVQRPSDLPV